MALRLHHFLRTHLKGIAAGQHTPADRAEARELLARLDVASGASAPESPKPRYARRAKAAKKGARK